jgi:ATP-dependent DNA helicase PIF1
VNWTEDQNRALELLKSPNNAFITGGAGTGKSTVIQDFIKNRGDLIKQTAVLASTGTAAILLGGRTFHSFFGLGIMEGGIERVLERALKHRGIVTRLRKTETVLIDEISMIGDDEFRVAEMIARKARNNHAPWGGLRIVAVGDFSQLPPVVKVKPTEDYFSQVVEDIPQKPWCFLSETWKDSGFDTVYLKSVVRSHDEYWNKILNELRWGELSREGKELLEERTQGVSLDFQGTRLYARRLQVEKLNKDRLTMLSGMTREYNTIYIGNAQRIDDLKRNAPVPEVLHVKEGALVMIRQNDPEYRFVNGSQGIVKKLGDEKITIELLTGKTIDLKKVTYSALDAEGEPVATATNFPLTLAWACTIHKAQGATLDRVHVDLKGVWEHGQAYVALSRVRKLEDLTIEGFSEKGLVVDPAVRRFYSQLG